MSEKHDRMIEAVAAADWAWCRMSWVGMRQAAGPACAPSLELAAVLQPAVEK
jgi:hypothetical protein